MLETDETLHAIKKTPGFRDTGTRHTRDPDKRIGACHSRAQSAQRCADSLYGERTLFRSAIPVGVAHQPTWSPTSHRRET